MNEEERFDFEQKHKEDLQRLRGFRLLDDDFMSKVFEDKDCVEFLLQIILKRDDLKVTSVSSQYVIKNLRGRSVRLDILAVDRQNQVYNIEIQREEEKVKYELKQQVVDISVMLSEKALGESIDESKHRELINDFIEKVGI